MDSRSRTELDGRPSHYENPRGHTEIPSQGWLILIAAAAVLGSLVSMYIQTTAIKRQVDRHSSDLERLKAAIDARHRLEEVESSIRDLSTLQKDIDREIDILVQALSRMDKSFDKSQIGQRNRTTPRNLPETDRVPGTFGYVKCPLYQECGRSGEQHVDVLRDTQIWDIPDPETAPGRAISAGRYRLGEPPVRLPPGWLYIELSTGN